MKDLEKLLLEKNFSWKGEGKDSGSEFKKRAVKAEGRADTSNCWKFSYSYCFHEVLRGL